MVSGKVSGIFHVFCLVNIVASLGFAQVKWLYSAVLVLGLFYAWYCGNKTVQLIIRWKPNRNRCNNILPKNNKMCA